MCADRRCQAQPRIRDGPSEAGSKQDAAAARTGVPGPERTGRGAGLPAPPPAHALPRAPLVQATAPRPAPPASSRLRPAVSSRPSGRDDRRGAIARRPLLGARCVSCAGAEAGSASSPSGGAMPRGSGARQAGLGRGVGVGAWERGRGPGLDDRSRAGGALSLLPGSLSAEPHAAVAATTGSADPAPDPSLDGLEARQWDALGQSQQWVWHLAQALSPVGVLKPAFPPSLAAPLHQRVQTLQGGRVEAVRQGGRRVHCDGKGLGHWDEEPGLLFSTGPAHAGGGPPVLPHLGGTGPLCPPRTRL